MQTLKKFYFGKQKAKVNTYIGGIGGTINTPALLAAKLGIAENRIKLFKVTGVDVECAITNGVKFSFFFSEQSAVNGITYYYDYDGYINNISSSGLRQGTKFFKGYFPGIINQTGISICQDKDTGMILEMPNCLSISDDFIGNYSSSPITNTKILILPRCTNLGINKLNNSVFREGTSGAFTLVCFPVSEQTSNAGGVEGDIQRVITNGSSIRYVTNFTPPNAVTNLSTGTIYNTAVQLNFTPPTSVNVVDFYECYANGKLMNEIKNSGGFITGLTPSTNYNIRIVAVDMFYNKSELSNIVNVSTNTVDYDTYNYINASGNQAYETAIVALFTNLKSQGLYNKIQAFYPFLGTTSAQHKWNAKNPLDTNAAFRLQFFGGGTHSNLGYQCNGTNAYANTFLVPSLVQNVNSNGFTVTVGTNNGVVGSFSVEIGCSVSLTSASFMSVKLLNTTYNRVLALNTDTGRLNQSGINEARGIFSGVRQSSSINKLFRNNSSLTNGTSGGTLPNTNIFIGCYNANGTPAGYSNQRIQFTAIHEGLADAEVVALHAIIDNFESAIGRKTW